MKDYLFSYGTLQKENVQLQLFGRTFKGQTDTLEGFALKTIEITDQNFLNKGESKFQQTLVVTNNDNDIVKGTVFEITTEELVIADRYEPSNYKRIQVILASGTQAWIYLSTQP